MASEERRQKLLALVALEPEDAFVLYSLGQECAGLGCPEEALAWYDKASLADPKNCYSYYHKAKALLDLDRTADAVATVALGIVRAREVGDTKAQSELCALRDELED
ncbi:MAG: hypothetical protein EXS10_08740 [Phycisphaerales bacterium]|nr:hypothetical protein [Phycisphaerales bacterium]